MDMAKFLHRCNSRLPLLLPLQQVNSLLLLRRLPSCSPIKRRASWLRLLCQLWWPPLKQNSNSNPFKHSTSVTHPTQLRNNTESNNSSFRIPPPTQPNPVMSTPLKLRPAVTDTMLLRLFLQRSISITNMLRRHLDMIPPTIAGRVKQLNLDLDQSQGSVPEKLQGSPNRNRMLNLIDDRVSAIKMATKNIFFVLQAALFGLPSSSSIYTYFLCSTIILWRIKPNYYNMVLALQSSPAIFFLPQKPSQISCFEADINYCNDHHRILPKNLKCLSDRFLPVRCSANLERGGREGRPYV